MCSVGLISSSLKGYRNARKSFPSFLLRKMKETLRSAMKNEGPAMCSIVHPLYAAEEAYWPAHVPLIMVDELRF